LSRPSEATESRGPPRIAGAGSGWREREAAKLTGVAAAPVAAPANTDAITKSTPAAAPASLTPAAAPAPPTPAATDSEAPKKGAYVPVHMRSRLGVGAPPTSAEHILEPPPTATGGSAWRTAGSARREESSASGSRYSAPGRGPSREGASSPAGRPAPFKDEGRSFSGRGGALRTESPANGAPAPAAGGAYRPGMFKKAQQ